MDTPLDESVSMIEMTTAECWGLLSVIDVGHVAFTAGSLPKLYPVNFWVHDHTIVFRTASATSLQLKHGAPVALGITEIEPTHLVGSSVIVEGRLDEITDPHELEILNQLGLTSWAPGPRDHWMRIAATAVSGRRIKRSRRSSHGSRLPYMSPG